MDLLQNLLTRMRHAGASDLLISTGTPPASRVDGLLPHRSGDGLQGRHIKQIVSALLTAPQRRDFLEACVYEYADSASNLRLCRKLAAPDAKSHNA